MTGLNPTERFSDRVADYVSYRPDYPNTLFVHLVEQYGLTPAHVVADIGSGTGLLARHFLNNGNRVYGVEPNQNMRSAAEQLLRTYPQFVSINGQAEATTLAARSVDWVITGQAFHWFDHKQASREFERILKPKGQVALVWNDRLDSDPFHQAYEALLHTHCPDYKQVNHRRVTPEMLVKVFAPRSMVMTTFPNIQVFDFDGLKGRLLSCSYALKTDAAGYGAMLAELKQLFEQHSQNDRLNFRYQTKLFYFGSLP